VLLTGASVPENSVVGVVSAVDPDAFDTRFFVLVGDAGGRRRLVGNKVQVAGPIDFEATPTLTMRGGPQTSAGCRSRRIWS